MTRLGTTTGVQKRRLAVLVTHPIQYYAPLYRCLAQRAAVDVKVIYLSNAGATAHADPGFGRTVQWDVPLLEGYDYEVLQPGTAITSRGFWATHDRNLVAALARARPDWLLVYGYASRMNWIAAHWARRHGVKVLYTSDSNSRNPERLVPLKKVLVSHFFRQIDAFLSPSERNVEYLRRYGARPHKIHRIPFAVDVSRFTPTRRIDLPRTCDFVWAGRFIQRKRGIDFIRALEMLAARSTAPINACMIGDGPQRDTLLAQSKELPAHCNVAFRGFVNQREMPAALQAAKALVFSSEQEPYGLMATEAAAAGLALIVTDAIGCVGTTVLAQPGTNTIAYQAGDVPALAAAMARLLDDPALLERMQHASEAIAKYHGLDHAADVIERVTTGRAEP